MSVPSGPTRRVAEHGFGISTWWAVCVPSGLHAEVGIKAAAAGKHLVIEKPIDVRLDAADRLGEAAKAAGIVITVTCRSRMRWPPRVRSSRPARATAR
jgi:UDP-N-acetyl-2-amino-2-deoxyglucuronate dehydrogenase